MIKQKNDFAVARQLGRVAAEGWALGCLGRPGGRRTVSRNLLMLEQKLVNGKEE